jgi:hypothetical protein
MCYNALNVNRRTAAATPKKSARPPAHLQFRVNSLRITFLNAVASETLYNHILSEKPRGVPHP